MNRNSLSYVLITPYTVAKCRTGGVISRLLSRVDLELIGAQMIAFDEKLTLDFANRIEHQSDTSNPWASNLLADYVRDNFSPSGGRRHRAMLMIFRGEDPCSKLSDICGALYAKNRSLESVTGETIRDTYADLIFDPEDDSKVVHFEPAVLTPRNQKLANEYMRLFSQWLPEQPNIVENITYDDPSVIERTLVVIKPDNWGHASSKPGTILDMFSRTGARIIGVKVHRMSVSETIKFYASLKEELEQKFSKKIGSKARDILESEFKVSLSDDVAKELSDSFGYEYALDQFQQVVEFMTGVRADDCPPEDYDRPGTVKCMILVYEGEHAVETMSSILGPTDPLQAPGGTVRREFGMNIMVNTAHASNTVEQAKQEMSAVKINENSCADILKVYSDFSF